VERCCGERESRRRKRLALSLSLSAPLLPFAARAPPSGRAAHSARPARDGRASAPGTFARPRSRPARAPRTRKLFFLQSNQQKRERERRRHPPPARPPARPARNKISRSLKNQKTHPQNEKPTTQTTNDSSGGGAGGQAAKDALGNDVRENEWLKTHAANTRQLTQGLKGDPTYLIVNTEGKIETYGLNAVCTHLGCVVPWVGAENKFKCPCHGSQYNAEGKVIRGPAPLSLALAHCAVNEAGTVTFAPWTETDFRTGLAPWWK
jgi:Rieske Fe-S protein